MKVSEDSKTIVHCNNEAETERLAREMARVSREGDLITLAGDLGVGKSVFARAFIRQLVSDEALEVPSPTYLVALDYQTEAGTRITHADLYRISDPQEVDELGFGDDAEAITLVEWPQNAAQALGVPDVEISISIIGEHERSISIVCSGEAENRFARSATIRNFLNQNGYFNCERVPFAADASSRNYEWIKSENEQLILMDAPKASDGPIIADGLTYSEIAHLAEEVRAFVAVSEALSDAGFCAPEIYAHDFDQGLVLLEFLGAGSVLDKKGIPLVARYCECARVLAHLHQVDWKRDMAHGHVVPDYDEAAMGIEASLFRDWYLPYCGVEDKKLKSAFAAIWQGLAKQAQGYEKSLVLRDMHSPNVIWREAYSGLARMGLIDTQDALIGPSCYDVASLAQDARVFLSEEDEAQIVYSYIEARKGLDRSFDETRFRKEYAVMGALRTTKVLGIFVRLDVRDGKSAYLPLLKNVKNYLERNLAHEALAYYRSWFKAAFDAGNNVEGG